MSKKHNKKKKIGKKGKLFWDEGVNKNLIKPTHEVGFKVVPFPYSYRNTRLSDSNLSKFAKGMPMVTEDFKFYKNKNSSTGATAYIEPEIVSTKDFPEYTKVWKNFLKHHTSKTLSGYRWKIYYKKEVKKEELDL